MKAREYNKNKKDWRCYYYHLMSKEIRDSISYFISKKSTDKFMQELLIKEMLNNMLIDLNEGNFYEENKKSK